MVLEHLFPESWLEKRLRYAIIIAFIYSSVSILVARLLFPSNSGIVSVIFLSLLLIPYIRKLLWEEEEKEAKERRFSIIELLKDNTTSIKVLFTLFFTIYFTYMFYSLVFPLLGFNAAVTFKEQLSLAGLATFSGKIFIDIFINNWWVLLACFMLALVVGNGAIFFIVWNASVWGAIFGFRAYAASLTGAYNPFTALLIVAAVTLPHVILEGGAYILAFISGGVVSDDVISKASDVKDFILWLVLGGIVYALLAYVIVWAIPGIGGALIHIGIAAIIIWLLRFVFSDFSHREVFKYNYYLFWLGVLIFLLGALIETLVLGNVTILQKLYYAALTAL